MKKRNIILTVLALAVSFIAMPATSAAPEQSVLPATQDEEFTGSYAGEEKIDSNSYSVKCSVAFNDTVQQVYGVTEKTELN